MNGVDWYLVFIAGVLGVWSVATAWACVSVWRQSRTSSNPYMAAWSDREPGDLNG